MTRILLSATALVALAQAPLAAAASPGATIGVAASTKSGLVLQVTPESGALPFRATFTLKAPKAVSWRLDFGDGRSETAKGTPPTTVTHVYRTQGSFTARLSAVYPTVTRQVKAPVPRPAPKPAQPAFAAGPLITLALMPGSKAKPLTVGFALATMNPGKVSTWQVVFGDGTRTGGKGRPPASVDHTYARAGSYRAYVIFTDKGTASYIRYSVPAGGLPVPVP
jgi:PKD repeat protein